MDTDRADYISLWPIRCLIAAVMLSLLAAMVAAQSLKRRRDDEGAAASMSVRLSSESVAADGTMPSKTGFVLSWLQSITGVHSAGPRHPGPRHPSITGIHSAGASDEFSSDGPPDSNTPLSITSEATPDQGPFTPLSPFTSDRQRQQTSSGWADYISQQRLGSLHWPAFAKVQVAEKMTAASFAASLSQPKRQKTETPAQLRQNFEELTSDKKSEESTLRTNRSSDEGCTAAVQLP